jgi:hypothetical protein
VVATLNKQTITKVEEIIQQLTLVIIIVTNRQVYLKATLLNQEQVTIKVEQTTQLI